MRWRTLIDIRLAVAAAVAWLAAIWGLRQTPTVLLLVCSGAAAAGLLLLVLRRHRFGLLAALSLGCVVIVLAPLAARQHMARASPLWQLANDRASVTVELVSTADPRLIGTSGLAGQPRVAVEAEAESVSVAGRTVGAAGHVVVMAAAEAWRDVLPGQRVRLDGSLRPSSDAASLSVLLYSDGEPELLGRPPWYQRAAGVVRVDLRSAVAAQPDSVRGLLPGLVDGDTSQLDPVLQQHFRTAGLTHLTAVSGTNLALLLGAVLLVLRQLRARRWVTAIAGVLLVSVFVLVARPSPSVLRAAAMGLVALTGLVSGRPRNALPALAAAVLALLLYEPMLAIDAGFAMSVLATAALLLVAPGWAAWLRARRVPLGLAEALAVATAAHVVTAPIIAGLAGNISLVAIPANILAEPVVALTTVLGFAVAVVAPFWLGGAHVLAWCAGWPCRWLAFVADRLGTLEGATVPWPSGMAGGLMLCAALVVLTLALRRAPARTACGAVAVAFLLVQMPVRSIVVAWPPSGWIFVACDVGQGDGLVLDAGDGAGVVIDAGPDPVAMDRCLSALGVTSVPLLVISHYHADHVGGLAGVLRGRTVGRVIAGPLAEPAYGAQSSARTLGERGLTATTPEPGASFAVGRVRLDVLGPSATLHGTRSDPNNDSLVLRATVEGVQILLPGDAEIEEQQSLLDAGVQLRADVLKVPHHGSAHTLPEFLAAANAQVALISAGADNVYGLPAPSLLTEAARLGVPVKRTDLDGDIAIVAAGGGETRPVLSVALRGTPASAVGS